MDAYETIIEAMLRVEKLKQTEKQKPQISNHDEVISMAKQLAYIEVQMELETLRKEIIKSNY